MSGWGDGSGSLAQNVRFYGLRMLHLYSFLGKGGYFSTENEVLIEVIGHSTFFEIEIWLGCCL